MIESFIENYEREDLNSFEKAKYLKAIWVKMGKPRTTKGNPDSYAVGKKIGLECNEENHQCQVVIEHLSLIHEDTPKEVKEAVKKGKLAMRSDV